MIIDYSNGGAEMQHFTPELVKNCLFSSIDSLLDDRRSFLANPETDFTRQSKKISFAQTILFPMIAGNDTLQNLMIDFFIDASIPYPSAMIQRRSKIKPSAFLRLFYRFTQKIPALKTFHGNRLIAMDGTRLNLPYNPSDPDTFIKSIKDRKGINQMHLNAMYDILNDVFVDFELQSIHQMDEKNAFCRLLKNQVGSPKSIFIADRGYAAYNIFAHAIHNNQLFLIRLPDTFAKGICTDQDHWLEGDTVDAEVTIHVGRKKTAANFQLGNYHYIPKKGHYDFIEAGSDAVDTLKLRVLKFCLVNGTEEYIVTNLPKYGYSIDTIKELYWLRWGIETAFRHLKYAGDMVHIHSVKRDFLLQEIYAKLTMYNFSSFMALCVPEHKNDESCIYTYVINHSQLQKTCKRFLRGKLKDVLGLLVRAWVPVRPGRTFERNLRRQSADTLAYR